MQRYLTLALLWLIGMTACKKYEDNPAGDNDFKSRYCNDPLAVNYNWGFPGKPDNGLCVYPRDLFEGTYILEDSILYEDFTIERVVTRKMVISAIDYNHLNITIDSFCANAANTTMPFTADRFYKATIDSVRRSDDSTLLPGRPVCSADTINGYMMRDRVDSTIIQIYFTMMGETGKIRRHKGTAIKQ